MLKLHEEALKSMIEKDNEIERVKQEQKKMELEKNKMKDKMFRDFVKRQMNDGPGCSYKIPKLMMMLCCVDLD